MKTETEIKTRGIVISLCDYTGNFVRPWADAGYECYCVDLRHSVRMVKKEGRIHFLYGDCRAWLPPERQKIAFIAAFPPCTHVTSSGARDFVIKGGALLADAISLFTLCELICRYSGAPYFIENPVGVLSSHIRKPDYKFDPCDYAGYLVNGLSEQYSKATCLWTGNGFVMPPKKPLPPVLGSRMHTLPPSKNREILRSATPVGFAHAVFQANADTAFQPKQQDIITLLEAGEL